MLDHRQTLPDLANSANSVRRSLEQGRARRQADPLTDPGRTPDAMFFSSWPRKSLRSRIFELILRILSHLPLIYRRSSPIVAHLGRNLGHLGPNLGVLGPNLGLPMGL